MNSQCVVLLPIDWPLKRCAVFGQVADEVIAANAIRNLPGDDRAKRLSELAHKIVASGDYTNLEP